MAKVTEGRRPKVLFAKYVYHFTRLKPSTYNSVRPFAYKDNHGKTSSECQYRGTYKYKLPRQGCAKVIQ